RPSICCLPNGTRARSVFVAPPTYEKLMSAFRAAGGSDRERSRHMVYPKLGQQSGRGSRSHSWNTRRLSLVRWRREFPRAATPSLFHRCAPIADRPMGCLPGSLLNALVDDEWLTLVSRSLDKEDRRARARNGPPDRRVTTCLRRAA